MIRYDKLNFQFFMRPKSNEQPSQSAARNQKAERVMKKAKNGDDQNFRRNGPVVKSAESILRPEESLWLERFVKVELSRE